VAMYNAGELEDGSPVFRWTLEIQAQEWLELAVIAALDTLTHAANWLPSDTTSADVAAERSTDATITFQRDIFMLGTVVATASYEIPPYGLLCDGAVHNRVDYPQLYERLAAAFIIDADTFRVPDLINKFIRGTDEFIGDEGGESEHILTVAEMPAHAHVDAGHGHLYNSAVPAVGAAIAGVPIPSAIPVSAFTGTGFANIQNTGGGQAHNNIPPYQFLYYYIIAR